MQSADSEQHYASYAEALARRDVALFSAQQRLERQAQEIEELRTEIAVRFEEIAQLTRMLEVSNRKAQQRSKMLKIANNKAQDLQMKIDVMHKSTTWRLLVPMRNAVTMIRRWR